MKPTPKIKVQVRDNFLNAYCAKRSTDGWNQIKTASLTGNQTTLNSHLLREVNLNERKIHLKNLIGESNFINGENC